MAILTIKTDSGEVLFPLTASVHTVGRGLESDIRIKDIKASRRHCKLVKMESTFKLVDLESGNGTLVNGNQVSEYLLSAKDRIQVGSTTLIYGNEAAPMKERPRKAPITDADRKRAIRPTSRVPAPPPNAASGKTRPTRPIPTQKGGQARPATSRTAPSTRKMASPQAGKPATKATGPQRPVTKRPGTARTQTATGRKTTSRIPVGTPGTKRTTARRTSMTDRYHTETSRKKINPMIYLIGGPAIALILIVGGIFAFGGSDELPYTKSLVEAKATKGNEYYNAIRFEDAIREWEAGIELCKGDYAVELRLIRKDLEGLIKRAQGDMKDRESARGDWLALKAEYDGNEYDTYKLLERAKAMLKRHAPIDAEWTLARGGRTVGELPEMIERLENQANSERTELDGLKFQNVRNGINADYLKRGKEDFSTALKEWKEYLSNPKVVGRDKKKANQQVETVNRQANGAWRSLRNKAERMNSDSAVRLLEKNLPRFQGCVFNGVDLGKEIQDKINALGG